MKHSAFASLPHIACALLLLGLAACAAPASAPDASPLPPSPANTPLPATEATTITPLGTSGIAGQVVLGPACPAVQSNDPSCQDKPYQAVLSVLSPSNSEITRFTTGADGKFRLALAPSDYILHPESPNGAAWPRAQEQPFTVLAGQFTQLTVRYDSGMR